MITRDSSSVPVQVMGATGLSGKQLVTVEEAGYSCYDVLVQPGTHRVRSIGLVSNHLYYCIGGEATVTWKKGEADELKGNGEKLSKDVALACGANVELHLQVIKPLRLFITYVPAPEAPAPIDPLCVSLADVLQDERNVDWTRGRTRRLLRAKEGFGASLHNVTCSPAKTSPLCYPRNVEAVYFIHGEVTYTWRDGDGKEQRRHYKARTRCDEDDGLQVQNDDGRRDAGSDTEDSGYGDGCMMLMDQHDAHELTTHSSVALALCIFVPPLQGHETHDFSKGGRSSF